ncbi:MAG TPA: tRNA lysidine(34) synthetase TilS, partial [Geobacterales bacterium]|nr:tRNA lysidine(34) synthetase TilS [Geobacterales bacterium]
MEPLVRQLLEEVRQHRLFQPNETVVVAVSGGVDSVFLLHLLQQLQGIPLRLIVAHLNHQLRGKESDGDAVFVADLARNQGLPFELAVEDVAQIARLEKLSLEDAGRRVRYAFLNEVADRFGARVIALGHHADDQAETFLMRLLRGAGSSGLGGMMISSRDGRYVRPLLSVTREQIVTAARKAGLLWREDASNADVTYLRNRLRHELLPL